MSQIGSLANLKKFLIAFIGIFFIVRVSHAQTFTAKPITTIGSNIDGYYEYLPAGYTLAQNAKKRYPVIFYLHGGAQLGSSTSNNLEALKTAGIPLVINAGHLPSTFISGTDTFSFIIICPQFINVYTASDVSAVINYIMAQTSTYRIDPGKAYLTGFSDGGKGTWQYLMSSVANAEKIAAAIPIEQFCYPQPDLTTIKNAAQSGVAIWDLHNTNDNVALPTDCATTYVNDFNSYSPAIPAKITISCIPSTSLCGHLDTTQSYIYNPSLFQLPGTTQSVYQWLYQYRQLAAGIPPTAKAGNDTTITFPVKQVILNGSASSDVDGTIASYSWQKISGPLSSSITSSTAATTTVTNLVAGKYGFKLTVTDNQGFTASDTVVITVVNPNPNISPIANAGVDATIFWPTNSYNLNGTSSNDPDGDIETYSWQMISGPLAATFNNAAIASPVVSNLRPGVYRFQLSVTDNQGAVGLDTMQLTVKNNQPNTPPVANAGTDINIFLPANTVTLNGSASYDPDGLITAYQWTKISGPASYQIVSPSGITTVINNLTGGVYSFQLTVTDDSGAVRKDTVNVTVNSFQRILIDVGASPLTTSPDGSGNYWNNMTDARAGVRVQNAITTTNVATSLNLVVVNRIDGTYNTSGNGLNNSNTGIVVNDYPVTATTDYAFADPSATNGMWQLTGLDSTRQYSIKFWGYKSGTTQRIIQIKRSDQTTFQQYDAGGNTNYNVADTFSFTGVTQMSFNIQVKSGSTFGYISVVDITMTSLPVKITSQPPVAHAGNDRTITLPQDSVHLDGSASTDPQGSKLKYKWVELSGPSSYQINNDSISNPQLTSLQQGVYQVQLKVTDSLGLSGLDTVAVTVKLNTALPLTANAGADQLITHPLDSVLLNGTASSDPNGTITSYAWRMINAPNVYQFADSSSATVRVRDLKVGVYSFQLTVTDNLGSVSKDTVNITVNIMPTPPATDTDVVNCGKTFKIVVLGSSTAYGDGADPIDSSWVNKFTAYVKGKNPQDSVINLAVPGYTTFQVLCPDNFVPPSGYPTPDSLHNITAALSHHPDAIIINLPTNDVAGGVPTPLQQANYARTLALTNAANIPVWITTTQPRNDITDNERDTLKVMRDWTFNTFGNKAVDFWTTVADTTGRIVNVYNYDDIHVDNYGHYLFYIRMVSKKILDTLCNRAVPVNIPPVAKAGNDTVIILPASVITLNGSASFDSDGSIASYRWSKISGPSSYTITDTTAANTTVTGLVQGVYQFKLTVTDDKGAQGRDTMTATVNAANLPPVAKAGNDTTIMLPANTATLNGTGSFDSDGSISKYRWRQISGPSSASITDTTAAKTTVTGLAQGGYQFELTVTDNLNSTGKDTMMITVNAADIPPVAKAGNDTTITLPANSATLNGTGSFDSDGSISKYRWRKISGPATFTIADTTASTTTVTGLIKGSYQFELTVTDNQNLTGKDTVMVTVNAANLPPVAKAGNDTTIILPVSTATLNGSASFDSDGSISKYRWRKISGPATFTITDTTAAKTTVTGLVQGSYQFELTVTDNLNAVGKDTMAVNVVSAQRILIDVGSASLTTSPDASGNYWNNMTDGRAGTRVANAVTTTNTATTVNLVVVNRIDGTYNVNGNGLNTNGSGVAVSDYPATATADYAFADPSATNGSWQLTGLDSTKQYSVKFWGMRTGTTDRVIQIKRADQTTFQQYDAGSNTNYNVEDTFTFSGVKQMTFNIQVKPGSEFGYINVVDIKISSTSSSRPEFIAANDDAGKPLVNIYPNPFSDNFIIDYNSNENGKVEVNVYNTQMQLIKKLLFYKNTTDLTQLVTLNNLSRGLYFVEIKTANNTTVNKLIKE